MLKEKPTDIHLLTKIKLQISPEKGWPEPDTAGPAVRSGRVCEHLLTRAGGRRRREGKHTGLRALLSGGQSPTVLAEVL